MTITFYGTQTPTFTWTDDSGTHQVQQDGPYEVTLPYTAGKTLVNANAVSLIAKDAGCKVTINGDLSTVVAVDNTTAGQTLATCLKQM